MRRKTDLPELLAPAGDFEALIAAVRGGADAVYVGGKAFSARAYAKNFDTDELSRAVEYCHLHGVKLYVTVNTAVYDREIDEVLAYAEELWRVGVDAVICADLGVIRAIKERLPQLELHASVQASLHNVEGARYAHSLGCTRIVPARELSLREIRTLTDNSPVEIEIFLHGALCVSYSGQCLMSSLVGGRSGNRGECAQPCRLPYNGGKYPLSLKDLSLAYHIPEIIESGVSSLKIEGRMKSAEYVYRVTKIYRKLLDERRRATKAEGEELARVFSRGGFTDGYFVGKTESGMTGIRSEADKGKTRELEAMNFEPDRVRVFAEAKIKLGEPAEMTLILGERRVRALGDVAVKAERAPLFSDAVKDRLSKMGNTFLSLSPKDISLDLDEGVNLSPASLNALRRTAAALLQSAERHGGVNDTPCEIKKPEKMQKRSLTAQFFNAETLRCLIDKKSEALKCFDVIFAPLEGFSDFGGSVCGVTVPPIIFDSEAPRAEQLLAEARERGARYALVGNYGAILLARRADLVPVGDFRLNVTNSITRAALLEMGVYDVILSPELTLPQARDVGGRVIVCGRVPLMLTERCFIKENFGCKSCSAAALTDRTGARFPMMREAGHRNVIFNSTLTYMGDRADELSRAGLFSGHFIFSTEDAEEAEELILKYTRKEKLSRPVRRMGIKHTDKSGDKK